MKFSIGASFVAHLLQLSAGYKWFIIANRLIVSFISAPKNNKIKQTRPTEKNKIMNDAAEPVRSLVMAFDRKRTIDSKVLLKKSK